MTKIIKKKEKGANRHWKNFLDKDYLGAHNLETGEELLVTIARFEGEEQVRIQDGKKDEKAPKPVLYFKEDVPKMIMNMTNGNTLTALYGPHPEDWIGKQIQIFATPVKAFGKVQDALRIRDVVPTKKIDNKDAIEKINVTKNIEDLRITFLALSPAERNDPDVVKITNELKKKYANPQ